MGSWVKISASWYKSVDGQFVLREVARTRGHLPVAERPQFAARRGLAERDAELLPDPMRETGKPPPHHLVDRGDRAALTMSAKARRRASSSLDALPGALPSISPAGPRALKRGTQSRTVRGPTSPIRAASVREPPSLISASARSRRACAASFASLRRAGPSKSSRSNTAAAMANLPFGSRHGFRDSALWESPT